MFVIFVDQQLLFRFSSVATNLTKVFLQVFMLSLYVLFEICRIFALEVTMRASVDAHVPMNETHVGLQAGLLQHLAAHLTLRLLLFIVTGEPKRMVVFLFYMSG